MDCKENGISDASGCESLSDDKNAYSLGSNTAIDVNEKSSCGGQSIDSVSGLAIPQIASVVNSTMEDQKKCFLEIEQMGDGDCNSKEDAGNSDFGLLAVSCNADDTWKQELVSDEVEQTQDSICDDVLLVTCNNQDVGKEIQDSNLSLVSTVPENMQEKEAPQAKEDEGCGGTILLPIGGNGTNIESTFVNDAPERIESLETTNHRESDEVGGDGNSYTFDGGCQEGRNKKPYQDAGSADDGISFIHSSCPFPDSILDSGVLGCSATENYLKDSSEIEGNVPIVVSPSLGITEMLSNNDGGLCSYDLDDITDTETISPDLKLVHEDELHTDCSEKNEKIIKNHVGDSPSESTVVSLSMNNEMVADMGGENFSQISPIYKSKVGTEANSPITDASLIWNFPFNFGKQGSKVCNLDNAVEPLRIVNGNGRIGGEVASASGTKFCQTGLSSSGRRARDGKQCKMAEKKRSAPRQRKSSKKKQLEKKLESIFKCSKQKRSSVSKPNRSSEWGLPSRTNEIFLQRNNIPYDGPPHHEPQKSLSSPSNGGHNRSSHNGYVEGSTKNIQPSSGSGLRLKVKFGKSGGQNPLNITVSQVSGNSSPSNGIAKEGTGLELPESANFVDDKLQPVETREHLEENSYPVKKLSYRQSSDSIRDEKNNQDAGGLCRELGGDVLDDDPHFSSSIMVEECERATGTRSLGAETSPDSEVINSVPDSIVSIEHKGDLRHSFFSTPEDVVNKIRGLEKEDELLASGSSLENGLHLIPSAKKGKHSKSKGNRTKKGKSKFSEFAKDRRKNESHKGVEQRKSTHRSIGSDDSDYHEVGRIESRETRGALLDTDIGKTSATNGTISSSVTHGEMVLHGTIDNSSSTESAWVRCDDCFKWRRIPASVVESIDESSRWICMNNSDKDFADCSLSQEMSNEEINAELGIGQDEADAYDFDAAKRGKKKEQKSKTGKQKACYKAIKTNQFLHRNRKSQTIDEIMVCHCKPSADGRSGCGEECLNRMLNIECLQNTCPAGSSCSNQQFQKRNYAELQSFQSGKKGFGLRLLQDVQEGKFLIEYVGEVLDMQSYESRQKEYASKGQKHFYFMTLNGNEVIDAGAKGNLGRFINHSCEPNCRTEKWMVNGEICVGIFAMQDLKKGQELTFDYNYVRVFGAAAKKCHCGSSHCRGYIGGDPLNGDVIIQSDSDEEYPELVILEDDENGEGILDTTSMSFIDGAEGERPQSSEKVTGLKDLPPENAQSQSSVSVKLSDREILPPLLQPTEVLEEISSGVPVSAVQLEVPVEKKTKSTSPMSSSLSILSSDGANADKMIKHGSGEDKKILPRPRPRTKTSRSSGSTKRDKGGSVPGVSKAQIIPVNKLQQQPIKSKGSEEVSPSGRVETFEGKLNELLDAVGGISKRRDSAKGYLKLLLLTAASRGTNNEGIQSNRDLSMILDALLKTKSRTVLVDVINKNGLQMLHNIMKQYRRDFKKTPILRKLLKVLEYLATREILALEHIIRRPPHVGMESFKDSILTLTEHDDKQVHQIARNFRDRWIPKPFRKPWRIEREERSESMRSPINSSRFRTSQEPRYDRQSPRPAEPFASVISSRAATPETASVSEGYSEPNSCLPETTGRKRKSRWDQPSMTKEQRTMTNGNQDVQDDLPPGFSSPRTAVPDAVTAQPQQKFLSRLPVSYGIPLSIVHQFGSPGKEDPTSWSIAPGMPFYPFPPLPPVSHVEFLAKRNETVMGNSSCSNEILPATSAATQSCWNIPNVAVCNSTRKREFSSDIGTSYFRQQKQNIPPWMRNNGLEKTANSPIPGNLTLEKKPNN